jgi:hypothetical protein
MLGAAQDTGTELDPELAAVAQALADGTTAPLPKDEGSPLVRALLGMAEVKVTAAGLAAASPEIQAALAFNTTLPAETRIAAAEAAATGGGLSIEALRKVYLEAGKASGDTPAGLRAGLYRALAAAHEPMDQEARLLAAWRAPAGGPLRVVWGRALGEPADALTPDPTVAAAAEAAIPALLLDGRLQKAQRWARVLALPRARDEAAIDGRLGILLALAGGDAATSGAAGGSGLDKAIRDGMGLPVAGPSWLALAAQRPSGGQEGPAPGLGAWRALATAADGRRAGQAALAALLLLGRETRPPTPLVADGVLRGLRDAGLGREAATLAAGWAVAADAGGGG